MIKKRITGKRLFVLDTNVLMHDPSSLFRFQEHDVYLPMAVLEELDAGKRGDSEIARNVRQTNRYLVELMQGLSYEQICQGVPLLPLAKDPVELAKPRGRLFFQTNHVSLKLPESLPGKKSDNIILAVTSALREQFPNSDVTLVSKDITLRIKAGILGIHAEDYHSDRVLTDLRLLRKGFHSLSKDFWETHEKNLESWQSNGRSFYRVNGSDISNWHPNDCLYIPGDEPFAAIVRKIEVNSADIEFLQDYTHAKHAVWGITARNREQNFALNLLMDPQVDFVTLQGTAGSGKTLLTLAAGLAQTLEQKRYKEIIMTRVTVSVGEDIGFLPGTEEEKMTPWMGALMDNLEVLNMSDEGGEWGRAATHDLLSSRVKVRSLNFMRGRTFLNKYIIIDEAQNLTSKQMKTLITRAGPGTKIVCLGDLSQIDTPYLNETTSGLTYAIDRFKNWEHSGHMTMLRGERSRLADYAAEAL